MDTIASVASQLPLDEDGLTAAEIVGNIPLDPAAIFTYLLLIVTFGAIFWVGRPRKRPASGPQS